MRFALSQNLRQWAGRKSAALVLTTVLLAGSAAIAAEDDEVVDGPIGRQPQEAEDLAFQIGNFDQQLFQNDGNRKRGEERIRIHADLQMAEIDRVCGLSDAQKQKLQLAARGDIQRFLNEAEVLRLKYDKLMREKNANAPNGVNEVWQQMWQDLSPLQTRMANGLTSGPTSLLMKVLSQTITPEQQRAYEVVAAERRRFRYEASIAVCLHQMEEAVALSNSQREELTKLLLEMPAPRTTGQYEMYVILIRLGAVPTEKLKPLFNDDQWKAFKGRVDQYRGVRDGWIQAGILDAEDFPEPAAQEKKQ